MTAAAAVQGSVKNAQFWDTGEPYNYVRLVKGKTAGQDILLAGGANHLTGIEPQEIGKPWKQLEQWARRRFPQAQNCVYQWGGQASSSCSSRRHDVLYEMAGCIYCMPTAACLFSLITYAF